MKTTIIQANPGYQVVRTGLTPCNNDILAWMFVGEDNPEVYALTAKGRIKIGPTVAVLTPGDRIESHDGRVFRKWQDWCDWATRNAQKGGENNDL